MNDVVSRDDVSPARPLDGSAAAPPAEVSAESGPRVKGTSDRDDLRREYEELKERFRRMSAEERESGLWLPELVRWVLENYSRNVDAAYIRAKYAGAGPTNQAKKAVTLAAQNAAVVGGLSGAAVTALEFATPAGAPLTVPAIGATVFGDVALTTRIQLRAAFDLSVIHGAPLSLDDAEDCIFILLAALGAKGWELGGDVAKSVGPKVVMFNVRRLLRTGLRRAVQELVKKVAGTQVARKLTERAALRLLVPGVNVPLSAGANYLFTKVFLAAANRHMVRRAAVLQPLMRLLKQAPELPRVAVVKALVVTLEAPLRADGWDEWQLAALHQTQTLLALSDADLSELEASYAQSPDALVAELSDASGDTRVAEALAEYLVVASALGRAGHDGAYVAAINKICAASTVDEALVRQRRSRLPR